MVSFRRPRDFVGGVSLPRPLNPLKTSLKIDALVSLSQSPLLLFFGSLSFARGDPRFFLLILARLGEFFHVVYGYLPL